jgi:hypothetical protein
LLTWTLGITKGTHRLIPVCPEVVIEEIHRVA